MLFEQEKKVKVTKNKNSEDSFWNGKQDKEKKKEKRKKGYTSGKNYKTVGNKKVVDGY